MEALINKFFYERLKIVELVAPRCADYQQGRSLLLARSTGCTHCFYHPDQWVTGNLPWETSSQRHQLVPHAMNRRTKTEFGLTLTNIYLHVEHSDMKGCQTPPKPSICVSLALSRHNLADVWATTDSLCKEKQALLKTFPRIKPSFLFFCSDFWVCACWLVFPSSVWT